MKKRILVIVAVFFLVASTATARDGAWPAAYSSFPPWMTELPIPQNETLYMVIKGIYAERGRAEALEKFIQQLMVKTPGDKVDGTDAYQGLPPGKYVVGMLFDTRERAQWWMEFSYRNREVGKGRIQEVKVLRPSRLPYMPSAVEGRPRGLISEAEALEKVKALPDVRNLSAVKKLRYIFTDYPRNGDLRYEIEILEERDRRDPLMVDFVMVSALNGAVTERFSEALGKKIE